MLPPFLSKFVGMASPNLSGCFLFLLEVLVATEGCSPSTTEVSSVELDDATSMLSLLLSDCESVDSVLMSSGSNRAIWLSLTRTVLFEFFGWMNEMFILLRIMKVAGTVGELFVGLKRTRSHRSKSVTAGVLFCVPVAVLQEFCPASWKCPICH